MSVAFLAQAFWLSLAVIVYTYAGYPLAIQGLARLRKRRRKQYRWWAWDMRPVSVIMAVHNGERRIESQLDHLLELEKEIIGEILVISDGSTDATNALLRGMEASRGDERLKLILLEDQVGKSSALNHGILAASGEILLFVDLRPRIREGSVNQLIENFADRRVGCVAGDLRLKVRDHDGTAKAVSGLYWHYEQSIRKAEAHFDSPVGVYGGFYAVRRSVVSLLPEGCILDDMFQPLSVIRQGYRSVLDRHAVVTDEWPAKAKGEFSRKVRTLAGNFQLVTQCPWVLSPQNRVLFQLVSHKLLRLVVPYCFVVLLATALLLGRAGHPAMLAFAGMQVAFWMMALVGLRWKLPVVGRLATPAGAMLMLNAAAVVGFYRFLFTPRPLWKSLWAPTATPMENTRLA
ncbi:Glycosyltransferase, catalytic subunit of cellulose synthase and poly-beta-1,6-N-acetylglucosamine synthase [Bryocella elongata]|uniref:Glycosyltransferase, catalytic subunit of cellulose synthase and poly-beta-1,6-N-acetylglucosamine synthase n=1 Tax=Bryocella elongata TaxID=863522 RepID=A0A1H5XQU0_9BACT|nr:glycosyltransferase [Bryocella elongata]SEG14088.1 Glycosyltransferase, catalytic subunit of cellulose synthase and poly-beta-1,6-N-acetylglucosamine synthase [Bryocella elongata]